MRQNERFVNCVLGRPIDRVPFFPIFGPWQETINKWKDQGMAHDDDWYTPFGFDNQFRFVPVELGIYPLFETEILEDEGETVVMRDRHGIVARERKDGMSMPQFLDYPIKDRNSWERFKEERLDPDTPGRFPSDWAQQVKSMKERDYPLVLGSYPWGFFGTPRNFFGVEDFLMNCALEPELVDDVCSHLYRLWSALWNKVLDCVDVDACWLWEDMAGRQGSLISPAMFRRFMTPYYWQLIDQMKDRGVEVFMVDSDGYVEGLIPLFMEAEINVLWPFEIQAGNDLMRIRTSHPELGMMGGMDKRVLAQGKQEIDAEIARVAQVVKQGRFVPSPDHLIPPDATWENYTYMVQEWRAKLC